MASRVGGPYALRERVAGAAPLPTRVGSLAGQFRLHAFLELTASHGGSQCAECFGWFDDPRHTYPKAVARG